MQVENDLQEVVVDKLNASQALSVEEEEIDDPNLLTKYLLEGKNWVAKRIILYL